METYRIGDIEGRLFRSAATGGKQLVYLHSGFGEVGDIELFSEFAEAGFDVVAPELPGFGTTPARQDWYKIEDVVFTLREIFDAIGIDSALVAGSSLGGWLAAELAVWFPERVDGLALIDPVGIYVEGASVFDMFAANQRELVEAVFPGGGDILKFLEPAIEDPGDPDSVLLHFFNAMEATARIGWNPYLHDPKLRGRLPGVKTKSLVIWGEDDGVLPRAHAEAYADGLADARLVTIAEAGHMPALEKPGEVVKAIEAEF